MHVRGGEAGRRGRGSVRGGRDGSRGRSALLERGSHLGELLAEQELFLLDSQEALLQHVVLALDGVLLALELLHFLSLALS